MSAFILDKAHIDVLVTAGLESIPRTHGSGFGWFRSEAEVGGGADLAEL